MNKLKLSSRAKVFKKFGHKLEVSANVYFRKRETLSRITKFSCAATLPYNMFNYNIRTRNMLHEQPCVICGATEEIEMHHRRGLKNKRTDNTLKGIKINLSRKQIPLCKACHVKVHAGKYDGPGIY